MRDFTLWRNGALWFDEQLVLEYTNNVIDAGAVGLGLAACKARFDNFRVTGDDIPDSVAVEPLGKLATTWGSIKNVRLRQK